jgi:hypothetical protein
MPGAIFGRPALFVASNVKDHRSANMGQWSMAEYGQATTALLNFL